MPKLKTKSSAKKRFKLTASGKIKRKHAFKSHILTTKETKRKHNLTKAGLVDAADMALPVGAIRLLDKTDVARKSMFTTHSLPLSILIEEIEQSCEDIVFIGIQPGDTEFYNPMSPEVFDAVDAVYDAVAANDFSHFVRLGQEQ